MTIEFYDGTSKQQNFIGITEVTSLRCIYFDLHNQVIEPEIEWTKEFLCKIPLFNPNSPLTR